MCLHAFSCVYMRLRVSACVYLCLHVSTSTCDSSNSLHVSTCVYLCLLVSTCVYLHLYAEAGGEAEAVLIAASAKAKAIEMVSASIKQSGPEGLIAVQLTLASDYFAMMGHLGGKSNTIMFGGDGPGDMRKMAAELATVFQAFNAPTGSGAATAAATANASAVDAAAVKLLQSSAVKK